MRRLKIVYKTNILSVLAEEVNRGNMLSCLPIRNLAPLCFPAVSLFTAIWLDLPRPNGEHGCLPASRPPRHTHAHHVRECAQEPLPSLLSQHCSLSCALSVKEAPCNAMAASMPRALLEQQTCSHARARSLVHSCALWGGRATTRQLTCKEGRKEGKESFPFASSPSLPPPLFGIREVPLKCASCETIAQSLGRRYGLRAAAKAPFL